MNESTGPDTTGMKTLEQLRESQTRGRWRNKPAVKVNPQHTEKQTDGPVSRLIKLESDYSINGLLQSFYGERKTYTAKFIPYPISFEDAKKVFQHVYEAQVLKLKDTIEYDEHNRKTIQQLLKYFIGHPDSALDVRKGIYLWGNVGRGKTVLMRCFAQFTALVESKLHYAGVPFTPRTYQTVSCKSIVYKMAEAQQMDCLKNYFNQRWCFDDVGAEENFKLYGNEVNAVGNIFNERYNKLQTIGCITHASSNFPPNQGPLTERYDARFESRVQEMFNPVFLGGDDKRQHL